MAPQPSSIDRLGPEIREAVGRLRVQGRTIQEIVDYLKAMDVEVSHSAMGRHVKKLATISERLKASRDMAMAVVDRFGAEPDNRVAQLNLEMMHSLLFQLLGESEPDEDGEMKPVTFAPKDVAFLATAMRSLAGAQKTDSDRQIIVRREMAKEAAKAVDKVAARTGGLTRETVDLIKAEILGIAK